MQLLNAIRFREVKTDEDTDLADEENAGDDEPELTKEQLLAKVANALNDVKLYKQGKIKLKSAREFFDEL